MKCKKCWRECGPAKFVAEFGMQVAPTYCDELHGGLSQTLVDLLKQTAESAVKATRRNVGGGLSKNRQETDEEREARLATERKRKQSATKNRTSREEEQKEWLDSIPNRGETNQSGTGTSKKAKKRQKMARKLKQRRK